MSVGKSANWPLGSNAELFHFDGSETGNVNHPTDNAIFKWKSGDKITISDDTQIMLRSH